MKELLPDLLECPACRGPLRWEVRERDGDRIEAADARCAGCGAVYPVRDGIGLFLAPDLPRDDPWEQAGGHLSRYLGEHPDVEALLMEPPADELGPADRFFRALVLEDRGRFAEAHAAAASAMRQLYTPESQACRERQLDYVAARLAGRDTGPVVDLASGRCRLVERLARALDRPIVATDFSPRVLRRDRRWLEFLGLYDRVNLLALDARRSPFRTGAVETLTTFAGLENVEQPDAVLRECRRTVSRDAGGFFAITQVDLGERPDDVRTDGWDLLLGRLADAGWRAEVENRCRARAEPTPRGIVLEGAAIDAFPEAATTVESGVLVAR